MKTFITNRDNNKICVVVENPGQDKLAFVMHGLGGFKDQLAIRAMVESFTEEGYVVVSWDAVHTFGESEGGDYEDATVTNYYADLEDVISWSASQTWYKEPFVLLGHSLGGLSVALYAEENPLKVKALAPLSPVISGELSLQTKTKDELDAWKKSGMQITTSTDGEREKRLKWAHMEDRQKYDLLPGASGLTMPTFVIVGSNDTTTPAKDARLFLDRVAGKNELHILNGAQHSFTEPDEQARVKVLIKNWLKSIN